MTHSNPSHLTATSNRDAASGSRTLDTGRFTVTVYTKNRDEAGSEGTPFSDFPQIGSTGLYQKQCTDLKELVRYKIALVAGAEAPERTEGVMLRFLPPTWYSTATS